MRFLLFVGSAYYPDGGADDLAGAFESVEAATTSAPAIGPRDWAHVLDLETLRIVAWSDGGGWISSDLVPARMASI